METVPGDGTPTIPARGSDGEFSGSLSQHRFNDRRETAARQQSYLPFQFGVRLLRKASMPSRKSSLM
jgi:hypothetical protein